MYPVETLLPHVSRVFKYLRRGYFNAARRRYVLRLALVVDVPFLKNLLLLWTSYGYSESALKIVRARLFYLKEDVTAAGWVLTPGL